MMDRLDGAIPLSLLRKTVDSTRQPHVLLIGPYDPKGGEYTFLAPPLGVWRLAGVLQRSGIATHVFDPNCCAASPETSLAAVLRHPWGFFGIPTTGMTHQYDLQL